MESRPENYDTLFDILNSNREWINENYPAIKDWLENNTPNEMKVTNSKYNIISNGFNNLFMKEENFAEF